MKKTPQPLPIPKPEDDGYIEIPNEFLEDLIRRADPATAVEMYVTRHTFGADRQWVTTTILELSEALERPKSKVRQGLKKVLKRGTVIRQKSKEGYKLALADPNS